MSMKHKALCNSCGYARDISNPRNRWDLPQSAKEIYNQLMKAGYDAKDFCYCEYMAEIRSLVAELDCYAYLSSKVEDEG